MLEKVLVPIIQHRVLYLAIGLYMHACSRVSFTCFVLYRATHMRSAVCVALRCGVCQSVSLYCVETTELIIKQSALHCSIETLVY